MSRNRSQGFTVLELLLVTVVIGVAAAVAVPSFVEWLPDYRLRRAARDLYSHMQLAKLEAVRRNANTAILFSPNAGCYYICTGSGADGVWTTIGDNVVEKQVTLTDYGSGVAFGHGTATAGVDAQLREEQGFPSGDITYNQSLLLFGPTGMSDAGFVYFENNGQTVSYAVGTMQTGLLILRKWDGGWH